jgi:hypothetical protein
MISEYTICALPEGHGSYRHYAIKVQRRGDRTWVLNWAGLYFANDAGGDFWVAHLSDASTFDEAGALAAAEQLAPALEVGGITVEQAMERRGR